MTCEMVQVLSKVTRGLACRTISLLMEPEAPMVATMVLTKECSATNIAAWLKTSQISFTSDTKTLQVATFLKACIEQTDLTLEASSALLSKLRAGLTT